jgi:hypothetical protein
VTVTTASGARWLGIRVVAAASSAQNVGQDAFTTLRPSVARLSAAGWSRTACGAVRWKVRRMIVVFSRVNCVASFCHPAPMITRLARWTSMPRRGSRLAMRSRHRSAGVRARGVFSFQLASQ